MSKQGKTNYVTQQQLNTLRSNGGGLGHIHANKDVLDSITAQDLQAWSSAAENSHTHDNKDILDTITEETLEAWDEVVAIAHSHSNRNAIDLFRYDSETNTIIIGTADNRVNFAAYGNVAAGGPRTGSGGGGLIQTVYGYGDLSGTFSDSDKNETFNAYTTARLAARIKQLEDTTPNVEWETTGSDYVSLSVNGTSKNLLTAHQSVSNIENAIRSLQSQIDSVASRTGFDELTASSLFAGTMAAVNIYGTLHGDADTVDNEHASAFAHVGAHNNLMASGNEFTFASSGFSGAAYINYRTAGGTNGSISDYYFCNGAGTTLWAMSTVANQAHNGQTAYDGLTIVSQALQSLQSQVLSSSSHDNTELENLEAVMSESLHSLQSQIDSLATRTGTEGIITTTLHADTLTAGNARLSGNSYAQGEVTAGSDERWKEHVQDVSADIIDRLVPCEWDWREGHGEGHSAGLIAQQVLKVLPFAVKGDAASGYMLNYNVFHAYEIKELQRLRKRVAELREIINNLKS